MRITADSGSTKTTWIIENDHASRKIVTQGINPFHQSCSTMTHIIGEELLKNENFPSISAITEIFFYGAGCTKEKSPLLRSILSETFPSATTIIVGSDMLGAAKALFSDREGIACILGTGSNSCLYNGRDIICNISPMGYILGDEGSGAVLGKIFVNALYKGGHSDLIPVFETELNISQADIIQKVYREQMPNRFLASLAPFIKEHLNEPWVKQLVIGNFRDFFRNNTRHYNRPDLPCSFVGSIAYHFESQLREAAQLEGVTIDKIMKEPLEKGN